MPPSLENIKPSCDNFIINFLRRHGVNFVRLITFLRTAQLVHWRYKWKSHIKPKLWHLSETNVKMRLSPSPDSTNRGKNVKRDPLLLINLAYLTSDQGTFISLLMSCFFLFRCLYLRMSRTSAIQLETNRKTIRGNATDSGIFDINLGVFKDSQYTRPYGDQSFPIGVMVNERVYLQLSVDSKDSRLAVIAQRCHATPDPNPNSTLQYDLIRNG